MAGPCRLKIAPGALKHLDLIAVGILDEEEPRDDLPVGREIDQLVSANTAARAVKDYAKAEEIRNMLNARKIILKVAKDGTTRWAMKP